LFQEDPPISKARRYSCKNQKGPERGNVLIMGRKYKGKKGGLVRNGRHLPARGTTCPPGNSRPVPSLFLSLEKVDDTHQQVSWGLSVLVEIDDPPD